MKTQPNIFLSYSHKNFDVADAIDKDFQSIGITFQRDVRDVGYMESFKKYMERIRDNGYALMIISDEYLKSENCMYEVLEFMKERDVQERILLIVLENANIYATSGKAGYIKHWNSKFEDINNEIKDLPREDSIPLIEDLKKVKSIKSDIADFLKIISDRKSVPLSKLKQDNYRAILQKIDFKDGELFEELFRIENIIDNEERDIELDEFIKLNPKFPGGYFLRAYISGDKGENKKARHYYEEALRINPEYTNAHFNLGLLLADKFDDKEGARKHYEEALRINPNYSDAHCNLGLLLVDKFDDKEGARKHYEEALRINPDHANAHFNLGLLLKNKFDDKEGARKHYEEALRINPDYADAHLNLGGLLENKFDDKEGARKNYEEALRINPDFAEAHYNLGILLNNEFNDKEGARKHYLSAILLRPDLRSEEFDKYFGI